MVSTLVGDCTQGAAKENVKFPELQLHTIGGIQTSCGDKPTCFKSDSGMCKEVAKLLLSNYPNMFEFSFSSLVAMLEQYVQKNVLKHLILMPKQKICCDDPIIVRNRPSFPLVYTTSGTLVAALFSGECRKCCKKFFYSSYQDGDVQHFYDPNDDNYFQITPQTVFEVSLLKDFTNNIAISACSFLSRAEVYNENHRNADAQSLKLLVEFGRSSSDNEHPWKLREKRVEDAWFLYRLACFYSERNILNQVNFRTEQAPSQRRDIEELCRHAYTVITDSPNPWIHHKCKTKGCMEGIYCTSR